MITAAFAVLLGIEKKKKKRKIEKKMGGGGVVRCSSPPNVSGYPFRISVCTLQRGHIIILWAIDSF